MPSERQGASRRLFAAGPAASAVRLTKVEFIWNHLFKTVFNMHHPAQPRRDFLFQCGLGFGAVAGLHQL